MANRITRKPLVWRDLRDICDYLATQDLAMAERFLDSAEMTFHQLAESPDLGNPCHFESPEAAGILCWHVTGFPNHLIFYRPIQEGVDVVRVIHGARNISSMFDDRGSQ